MGQSRCTVILCDIHHLSISRCYQSLRTSLPGELRLAVLSPGWKTFQLILRLGALFFATWSLRYTLGCSERLAQTQLAAEADADMTFAPAINDKSLRMAISKELREVREDVSVADRLTSCQPPKLTAGELTLSQLNPLQSCCS